jgi:hypothetical protein
LVPSNVIVSAANIMAIIIAIEEVVWLRMAKMRNAIIPI